MNRKKALLPKGDGSRAAVWQEMKPRRDYNMKTHRKAISNLRYWTIYAVIMAIVLGATWQIGMRWLERAEAETTIDGWIICQPGDYINARRRASRKSESLGRLETGDRISLDGITENGFCHVVHLGMEESEGWVYVGYIVLDEPEVVNQLGMIRADGRVACRKYVEGPRRCWGHEGEIVSVYYRSSEWTVTNKGFIRSEYVEVAE